ncbi:MAG: hypothetical protein QNL72_01230 [Candidatus Planktophila sp.]|tara:strand:- start:150 stop:434 length:285 start_codon:yes stop_codon:yes gene_type:complete
MMLLAIMLVTRNERPKFHQVVGIAIGFIGVITVLGAWCGLDENPIWVVLVLLAAVTCYEFSFPYARKFILPHKLRPESMAAAQVTSGAITLTPF